MPRHLSIRNDPGDLCLLNRHAKQCCYCLHWTLFCKVVHFTRRDRFQKFYSVVRCLFYTRCVCIAQMPPKVAKPGPQAVEAVPTAPIPSVDLSLTFRTHPSVAPRPEAQAAAAEPSGPAGEDGLLRNHLESTLAPYTSIHVRIVSDWLAECIGTYVSHKYCGYTVIVIYIFFYLQRQSAEKALIG